jgi:CDGSH-type Zn-finger protein
MKRPYVADKCPKQYFYIYLRIQLEVGKEYYYCACGLSKNQPFCDGSHKGSPYTPIKFKAEKADNYLCMCKHSKNLPYCDGTHQNLEF